MIKQSGEKWVLYSADGSKVLGRFGSKKAAEDREKQIKQIVAIKKQRGGK